MDESKPTSFSDMPWYLQILIGVVLIGGAWITYSLYGMKPDAELTAACATSVNDPGFGDPDEACNACCNRLHGAAKRRNTWFGVGAGPFTCTCVK